MRHPASARPVAGAVLLLIVVAACGASAAAPSATTPASLPPAQTATPAPTPAPTAASSAADRIVDTSTLGDAFALPLRLEVPDGWMTLLPPSVVPARTLNVLHGDADGDPATWWGLGVMLVDGAMVRDPGKDATTGKDAFVPWPASYIDYLAALPGVDVLDGPTPITVGGVEGRAITVRTPEMAPTVWLKDDTMWLGGGSTGVDPSFARYLVELRVGGTPVLIEYDDDAAKIAGRVPQIEDVLASITFGRS